MAGACDRHCAIARAASAMRGPGRTMTSDCGRREHAHPTAGDGAHARPARTLLHAGEVGIADHDQVRVGAHDELRIDLRKRPHAGRHDVAHTQARQRLAHERVGAGRIRPAVDLEIDTLAACRPAAASAPPPRHRPRSQPTDAARRAPPAVVPVAAAPAAHRRSSWAPAPPPSVPATRAEPPPATRWPAAPGRDASATIASTLGSRPPPTWGRRRTDAREVRIPVDTDQALATAQRADASRSATATR